MAKRLGRVMVVDDSAEMARTIADGLADRNYEAVPVSSGREALDRLAAERFDALITDLRMPHVDGLEILAASRRLRPDRPVIVMTAFSAVDTAVESIRQGAYHYLTKPFKQDELAIFLARALEEAQLKRETSALKTALRTRFSASTILGTSPSIQAVRDRIERVADAPAPVIILGETGTGKGLVARALHADSQRAGRAFVSLNCAALPEQLLESELFGYVKGAFTGATTDRARPLRRGRRWVLVSRRDRRDAPVVASEAAPCPRERYRPPGRRGEADRGGCPHHSGHASQPRSRRSERHISRRPALSARRRLYRASSAARPAGRHPGAPRPLRGGGAAKVPAFSSGRVVS